MRFFKIIWYKQLAILVLIFNRRQLAISYWQKIAVIAPNNAVVPAAIAHLKAELGLYEQAIALLKTSIELDGSNAVTWYNLGFLQQQVLAFAPALSAFDRAIELKPQMDLAYYGKSLALIKLNRTEEAIPCLQRTTQLQPLSPYGWYQLAHAYKRLGQLDNAKRIVAKLADFEPGVARQLKKEMRS